jgi:hypothetical protein
MPESLVQKSGPIRLTLKPTILNYRNEGTYLDISGKTVLLVWWCNAGF